MAGDGILNEGPGSTSCLSGDTTKVGTWHCSMGMEPCSGIVDMVLDEEGDGTAAPALLDLCPQIITEQR